jgi:hypothetical protein
VRTPASAALVGQLNPAPLGAVDQLIQPRVIGQLLAQTADRSTGSAERTGTAEHRIVIGHGHGHGVLPTEAPTSDSDHELLGPGAPRDVVISGAP